MIKNFLLKLFKLNETPQYKISQSTIPPREHRLGCYWQQKLVSVHK